MSGLDEYRASPLERERTAALFRIVPRNRATVLDIGARDGFYSRLLTQYFGAVTALDLVRPDFAIPGVTTVAGDATRLQFADKSFDCVFCAEVLEHIPRVADACRELARVARHEIIVGTPFRQDIRAGRTTCRACGKPNPPWGHVNSFTEERLQALFPGLRIVARSFAGSNRAVTNPLSTRLMDLAGNPYGPYSQEEPCVHCGARLLPPPSPKLWQKVCLALANRLNSVQTRLTAPHANWIHLVFSRD